MNLPQISGLIPTILVAGLLGGLAMETVMWRLSRNGWSGGSMAVALGGLLTGKKENALRVGATVHILSALVFGAIYTIGLSAMGATSLTMSLPLGMGAGFVHGLLVSLALVWVVAERHPLEEFKGADLAIGLSHLAGHVAFGGTIGLVVGLFNM